MCAVTYTVAQPGDQAALVDFANYVFSQAHRPHDFKRLLPKVYGDHVCTTEIATHYIARQDGSLRAMAAMLPLRMHVLSDVLRLGFVGTVCVHPYARGEGHMKRLMGDLLNNARTQDFDLLVLGGQRQRYGYFGFQPGGTALRYTVTATNLRHAARDAGASEVDLSPLESEDASALAFVQSLCQAQPLFVERPKERLADILHSWESNCLLIRRGGQMIGYVCGAVQELGLTDESALPLVLKALLAKKGLREVTLSVAPFEAQRIRALRLLCERASLETVEMINVLNWPRVLSALLALKASFMRLEDGCAALSIDGETLVLRVKDGVPSVSREAATPELSLSHAAATQLLFGPESAVCGHPLHNWLPLPFFMRAADGF